MIIFSDYIYFLCYFAIDFLPDRQVITTAQYRTGVSQSWQSTCDDCNLFMLQFTKQLKLNWLQPNLFFSSHLKSTFVFAEIRLDCYRLHKEKYCKILSTTGFCVGEGGRGESNWHSDMTILETVVYFNVCMFL